MKAGDVRLRSIARSSRRRPLVTLSTAAAMCAALCLPGAAAAGSLHREFLQFAECPTSNPAVISCVHGTITGGEFVLGSKAVTIEKTITLQGGVAANTELVPPSNGETLSKTSLKVPGGLTGIPELELSEVDATAELAGTAKVNTTHFLFSTGAASTLPLKVHLENAVLGESCYAGSESEPITLQLTTGTTKPPAPNTPISGSKGTPVSVAQGRAERFENISLVDNSFAVSGVNGCGGALSLLLDPVVDEESGLPAEAGKNTAIQDGTLETSTAKEVAGQLALPEIGRCVKGATSGHGLEKKYVGEYEERGCTESLGEGPYEWKAGAAKPAITGSGHGATLEGVGGAKVTCKLTSLAGDYTGAKTLSATLTMTGCELPSTKATCQSGATPGEIVSDALTGTVGFIEDTYVENQTKAAHVVGGLVLSGAPTLLSAECAGASERLVVGGSAIGSLGSTDKMTKSLALAFTGSEGKQEPESFEEEAPHTLTATMGSGSEHAALTMSLKVKNEEKLDFKVENGFDHEKII